MPKGVPCTSVILLDCYDGTLTNIFAAAAVAHNVPMVFYLHRPHPLARNCDELVLDHRAVLVRLHHVLREAELPLQRAHHFVKGLQRDRRGTPEPMQKSEYSR